MRQDELPQAEYVFVSDSQELDDICHDLGINDMRDEITAALVEYVDGDYGFVYFSEDTNFKQSRYWDWQVWHWYADAIPDELDLQDADETVEEVQAVLRECDDLIAETQRELDDLQE